MTIRYAMEPELSIDEFVDVLRRSTLAERRPVDDRERIAGMLENAGVIVTARDEHSLLVGVSRAISDYHYCTYLSDLAVDQAFQRRGIGNALMQQLQAHAVANGFHRVFLETPGPNERAIRVYQRCGTVCVGQCVYS